MINQEMDEVVLVKGWKKAASWSFPRGKINKDELDLDCAIREVYEETGFDIKKAGLAGNDELKHIDVTMREQHMRLYVFRGVPMDTHFEPRTRKEISKIQWYKLSDLPTLKKKKQQPEGRAEDLATNANRFYMVAPFLGSLNKWIAQQRKLDKLSGQGQLSHVSDTIHETQVSIDDRTPGLGPDTASTADDMGRLLASLRHSRQPSSMTDLPEVSKPLDGSQDVAAQLSNFIDLETHAASNDVNHSPDPKPRTPGNATPNGKDSNALMALLRGKDTMGEQVPQTPLDQVIEHPAVPPSPHRRNQTHIQHNLVLNPQLPLQTPRVPDTLSRSQPRHMAHLPIPPPHTSEQPFQPNHQGQIITHNLVPAQRLHQPPNPTASPPSPMAKAHSNRQVQAPYQRTGDPEFSRPFHHPSNLPSLIPSASKLPPPKLTTHSSALLDLFKANRTTEAPVAVQRAESAAHLCVIDNIDEPHKHSEVSPLTEQSYERDLHIRMTPHDNLDQQKSKLGAWGNFQATSDREIAEFNCRSAEKKAERFAEEAHAGLRLESQLPVMKETWRQIKVDDQANQRKVVRVEKPTMPSAQANESTHLYSPSFNSNIGEHKHKFAVAEMEHARNAPKSLSKDVPVEARADFSKTYLPMLPVKVEEISTSNLDHKAALLNLFRKPSTLGEHVQKGTTSLELPGPPVELSAMPSPGYNPATSLRPSSYTHNYKSGKHFNLEVPNKNGKARKSPMSATVNGPLNVPNFDTINQKIKEQKGETDIGRIVKEPEVIDPIILPGPLVPHLAPRAGQGKQPASAKSNTVAPKAVKSVDNIPVPFQPQILRRPIDQSPQPQASLHRPLSQYIHPSKEPLILDRRLPQSQGHEDNIVSLSSNTIPSFVVPNFSSTTPISPLSERMVSRQGISAVASPQTSRSRLGSIVSPISEETTKSGGMESKRSQGDRRFLLGYLEEVAKGRR